MVVCQAQITLMMLWLKNFLSNWFGASLRSSGTFSVDSQSPLPYTFYTSQKPVPIKGLSWKALLHFKSTSTKLFNLA